MSMCLRLRSGGCPPTNSKSGCRVSGPNTDDVKWLLVLDQMPIHKMQAAKDALEEQEMDIAYVPAGCTSLLQPADVYWNQPFKANLRRS
ncbi:hypothetical protein HPB49_007958 [Dermacentor silvarum]|uniref:Uncharacterized protein n=1 Tax=Dermacentor silvarum TaxID=543639 RepID=A0ACB8DXP9_DERSI|nr:hypothetical protein HPB49_007958 [Dermacentor silvarum]